MRRKVESFQVMAVSDEFLKILEDVPEAASCSSVEVAGKYIAGPKCIMVASSMQQIEQNLPAMVAQLADAEHTHLHIVHKSGDCWRCELKDGENPNVPKTDCPHILKGEVAAICRSWTIDTKTLQKVAV